MAIRVLFIESGTELGGAQAALLTLLRSLDRDAVDPLFVSLGFGGGDVPTRVAELGIPVFCLPYGRFRNPAYTAQRVRTLAQFILRGAIDVVLCNSGHPLLFGRPAAILTGRPCAWWVHGYFPEDPLKGHMISLAERMLRADLMLANSGYTANMLRRAFPEHSGVVVLRPPVDTGRFFPTAENGAGLRRSLGLKEHIAIVGHFGRLHPFKGQDVFLRAARELKLRGCRCHFLVVGGAPFGLAPDYEHTLRQFVAANNLADVVSFLGAREDINELMNACDVVVHSSIEPEPWGLVVAEAMAAGRAVVATAGGGPGEMIRHGVTGQLVPPNEPSLLANAVAGLLENPARRRLIGAAARETCLREWNPASAARDFTAALRALCGRQGRA